MNERKYNIEPISSDSTTSSVADSKTIRQIKDINLDQELTNFSMGSLSEDGFRKVLPAKIDLFSKSKLQLDKIEDAKTKNNVILVLSQIIDTFIKRNEISAFEGVFSKFELSYLDDKSAILEWIYNKFRVGFTIEPLFNESATYIIVDDHENGSFQSASQLMNKENYEQLINAAIDFVVRNV